MATPVCVAICVISDFEPSPQSQIPNIPNPKFYGVTLTPKSKNFDPTAVLAFEFPEFRR